MRHHITSRFALALLAAASLGAGVGAQAQTQSKPDNTTVNKRDRDPGAVTADNQKSNADDRNLSAKIRRSIVTDKSLSTYAHNVKVVAQNGVVTLKGPVRSEVEMKSIIDKATEVAGSSDKVVNQMSVTPESESK